jgi:hypothetical protein
MKKITNNKQAEIPIWKGRWSFPDTMVKQFINDCRRFRRLDNDTIVDILNFCDNTKNNPWKVIQNADMIGMIQELKIDCAKNKEQTTNGGKIYGRQ